MPAGAVLLVRLRDSPDGGELDRLRHELLAAFDPDDFFDPLHLVRDASEGPVPIADGSVWLDVGTHLTYYGKGYERGDVGQIVRLAEWLEQRFPGGEVWYGHDCTDESIRPFGPRGRDALLAYYREVGHEPYDAYFRKPQRPAVGRPAAPPTLDYRPPRATVRPPANRWVYVPAGVVAGAVVLTNVGLVAHAATLHGWAVPVFALFVAPLTNLAVALTALAFAPLVRALADGATVRPYVMACVLVPPACVVVGGGVVLWAL